jgi:DNA-binding CsgD family transcriptional regulator
VLALAGYATAVLYNGLGRYDAALAAAKRSCEHDDLGLFAWALVELVEAAARSGKPEEATSAFQKLSERTTASGTDWALGIEARSRALLSDRRTAEPLYRESIERLSRTRIAIHLARAHLLYGEWLRRENRRRDARDQLRLSHEMLDSMGAESFAQRAARELLATGGTARKRIEETRHELTAQEAQVARLAAEGSSNPEIGAQLFISRRTVEYHLHKVFAKLGISSRNHLHRALSSHGLANQPVHPQPASPA